MSTSTQEFTSGLSLQANFLWTFVGNVVYAGCQWGMLVVLAKLGSPELVGQFALGLAITAPVMIFSSLQLRGILATDAKREYLFGDYLGLRLISTALALLVIVGIVLVLRYRWETALVILVIGIAKAFESISDVLYGLLQQHERMDHIAKSMMIKGILSLVALSVGVYLTGNVLWGATGLAVAWAVTLAGYDIYSVALTLKTVPRAGSAFSHKRNQEVVLRPRWEIRSLSRLTWLALPLGVVMMLISLNTNIPRYFIARYLGERELGIFAALAYLMVAGSTVVAALGQSASPRLSQYYAAGNGAAFRTLLLKLSGIGVLMGGAGVLVALIVGPEVLTLLYGPEYAGHTNEFFWLMVMAGVGYVASFLGYGMTAARYFRAQMPLFTFVIATAAMTCIWLIPYDGLHGAAMALVIATVLQLVGSFLIVVYTLYALHRRTGKG